MTSSWKQQQQQQQRHHHHDKPILHTVDAPTWDGDYLSLQSTFPCVINPVAWVSWQYTTTQRGRYQPAVAAVEVVGVVGVILEDEGLLLDDGMALLTDVLPQAARLLSVVARTTQVSGYTQERTICLQQVTPSIMQGLSLCLAIH